MDTQDDRQLSSPQGLLDSLGRLFGPFVSLFGSVAAVSATLVFAGFLSDYGAYRLAGLPRLNLTVTALAEQGADTLIDSLSLLAGGLRWVVIALLLLSLVALWGWHEGPRLRPWARSVAVHRFARVLLLVFSLLLTGGLVERAQRSLSGAHHSQVALEEALATAYDRSEFPTPYDRELEIERQTYELRIFTGPNWGARFELALDGWRAGNDSLTHGQGHKAIGIALRQLPEARTAARHIYGWLGLSALTLCVGVVLLAWWGKALREVATQTGPTELIDMSIGAATSRGPVLLRTLQRCIGILGEDASQPIERVLTPLTLILAALSLALLPLAHGLLARESLGAETVMVYLSNGQAEIKKSRELRADASAPEKSVLMERIEASRQDPPDSANDGPTARLDCKATNSAGPLENALQVYQEAQRDFLHERSTDHDFAGKRDAFFQSIHLLAGAAIETSCADSVVRLWSAMPSHGVRALYPEVADAYQQMVRRVQTAYGVRIGTLLGYPRDGQGLTLVESIVPLPLPRGGQASIVEIPRESIQASVVIPDIELRRVHIVQRQIQVDPDNTDSLKALFFATNADALEAVLDLVERRSLHANAAGVGITTLGRLAGVSTLDRPRAATRAVDLLDAIARKADTDVWPEKSDEIRSAAVTAMQLPKSPYAAYRLIATAKAEPIPPDGCVATSPQRTGKNLSCLPTLATAAGFLFQDIASELQNFRYRSPPKALTQAREDLVTLLLAIIVREDTRDHVRGAACTALGFAGKFDVGPTLTSQFWSYLQALDPAKAPFSSPVCMLRSTLFGLDRAKLRPWLRQVALGRTFAALSADEPSLHHSMRLVALGALADLGLSNEDELLFNLFVEAPDATNRELSSFSLRAFSEVASEALAGRLVDCMLENERSQAIRERCMEGLSHLQSDYDGDEGVAARLHAALANETAPDFQSACSALGVLLERGSKWLLRLGEDDVVMKKCDLVHSEGGEGRAAAPPDAADFDRALKELRDLLKRPQSGRLEGDRQLQ